jgi:glycosyltransferase involved in cell wall biosynthesis
VITKEKKFDLGFMLLFRRLLLGEKIQIVNPHHFIPFFYTFLVTRFTGVKVVYTEHSRWQLEQLSPLKKVMNRWMLRRIDAIVAISKQIGDFYINQLGLDKRKVHFISNGIDLERFKDVNGYQLRKDLNINEDEIVLGMVANIRPEKNHKCLISAFHIVSEEVENVRLLLVGVDFMNGEIHRFVSDRMKEKVLFLGLRKDVPEILKTLDIFCLPSIYEGLPLTLLEAMASGVPVIGADVLGINEVIKNNSNGLLFSKNDDKRLADLIKMLLKDSDLRKRISQEGRSFVERYYSLDDKIKEYDQLFDAVSKRN